jgi:ubiquinone/menaquinone biosynthesis C-methylase UbiE
MSERRERYIPAAGHDWLLPLYDPLLRWLFREASVKRALLEQAEIRPGQRVLDVGCGTGTLAVEIQRACPEARVVGIDGDPKALAIARRKAARAGVPVELDRGLADALPYAAGSFDRVVSSLVFHHLARPTKERALAEILRVLAPGGRFHLLDFGRPVAWWERALTPLLFRSPEARDNVEGRLSDLLRASGFGPVDELARRGALVASLWYYRAARPARAVSAPA